VTDTLATYRTNLRARLDEASAHFFTDANLNQWLNEGARQISRRTETLLDKRDMGAYANVNNYVAPNNVLRIHRIEYSPDNFTTTYNVEPRAHQEMDQYWASAQNSSTGYPSFFCLWGYPPNLTIQLYPVPSTAGRIRVYYYRLPVTADEDTDLVEVPSGYEDLVVSYAEYMALRKDADPRWAEAKSLFEEQLGSMIDMTRHFHDQAGYITSGTSVLPTWLVGGGGW
jgi:hypothetical protein